MYVCVYIYIYICIYICRSSAVCSIFSSLPSPKEAWQNKNTDVHAMLQAMCVYIYIYIYTLTITILLVILVMIVLLLIMIMIIITIVIIISICIEHIMIIDNSEPIAMITIFIIRRPIGE